MKKLLFVLPVFLITSFLNAQTGNNPFSKFGYDVLVGTSSKGEFEEFHDQKDIVEIGSILYDTKTKKIIKVLDKDSTIIDISAATAATSIDPHCERYYWISPYAYCFNNPIKYTDPDGRDGRLTGQGTKDDPFVITAAYYYENGSLNKDQIKGYGEAVSAYNNNGKSREVTLADGTKAHVQFNLSVEGVDDVAAAISNNYFAVDSDGEMLSYGNRLNISNNEGGNGDEYGSANGWTVSLNNENITESVGDYSLNAVQLIKGTSIHEIGHNLGLGHSDRTNMMNHINITRQTDMLNGGKVTHSPSYPKVDSKGAAIIVNRVNTPRSGSLGVIRRPTPLN